MSSVEPGVRTTVALALSAALLLGACARAAAPGSGTDDPDSPVAGPPGTGTPGPRPSPQILEPRTGLVDVRPHRWREAVEVSPGRLLVTFFGGVEQCFGVDRVEVDERRRSITVTLFAGRVPTAETCIEIAVFQGVVVELDEPLGARSVRDGAA